MGVQQLGSPDQKAQALAGVAAPQLASSLSGLSSMAHMVALHLQVEAIKAGTQPGLAMVVGPPGTGKTDTAVQIMHVLYHNCPGQRTLLIAHSNQAWAAHLYSSFDNHCASCLAAGTFSLTFIWIRTGGSGTPCMPGWDECIAV